MSSMKIEINESIINKYYADVSQAELNRLENFLETHEIKQITVEGKNIRYYSCGKGAQTILTFSGGHSGLETVYETVLGFEHEYRMVAVDISLFEGLAEFSQGVDNILEREGVDRVFVIGQSLSGMYSQIYFKRNYGRIVGMVLTNTFAPSQRKNKRWPLILLRLFPFFLIGVMFRQKIRKWTPVAEIPTEAKERMKFKTAFMNQVVDQQFSKGSLMNALNVAIQFHRDDEYTIENFKDWKGKILIISSKDDPCYEDVDALRKNLPNAELFLFPEGYRHMAPMVFRDEFHGRLKDFFKEI